MDEIIANQKELAAITRNIESSINEMKQNIKTICATTQNMDSNISVIADNTKISAWSSTVLAMQVSNWRSDAVDKIHSIKA